MELMKQGQQHTEQRDHRGQTSLRPQMTVSNENEVSTSHAIVPGPFGTPFAVLRHVALAAKAVIGQDNAAPAQLLDERMELVIRDSHRVPIDQPFQSG